MAKLTLSLDAAIIAKAKRIASANQTSVSAMFSQFIRSLSVPGKRPKRIGPLTRKLSGIVKLPPNKDYQDLLAEALLDKHGLAR